MQSIHLSSWIAFAVMLCSFSMGSALGEERKLVLFTLDEARQLRLDADAVDETQIKTRGVSVPGPFIEILSPTPTGAAQTPTIETSSPTTLTVLFKSNRAPVDMESLDIEAQKGFFSKSLTPMLKPYIQGTNLRANAVEIPTGNFMIEIAIADEHGARTANRYRLVVK